MDKFQSENFVDFAFVFLVQFSFVYTRFLLYFERFSILRFRGDESCIKKSGKGCFSKENKSTGKQKIALPQEQSPLYGPFLVPKPLARRKWENRHFLRLAF